MIIKNAKLSNGIFDILVDEGIIKGIGSFECSDDCLDAKGKRVIPGLIDTHIHAFGGYDLKNGGLNEISKILAAEGTTCWLPTTFTDSIENLVEITGQSLKTDGAEIAGFHLEGPFISASRKGAQNEDYIINADVKALENVKNIKKISVAPENEGVLEFIKKADYLVSIGHTDCTYEQAIDAIDCGANCLTHTFNAMSPMLHRAPGPIGAAFERGIYAEVICDGMHVSPVMVKALYKMFTSDRMILISDAISPAGCPDGEYESGGLKVFVRNGIVTLPDGTLAGGSNSLLYCVKKAVEFGIDFYEAVKMATETPAKSLGLNKGQIKAGFDADLVILNDDYTVDCTIIGGKRVN